MHWRASFVAEVSRSLWQLGLRQCPVCGTADSLGVGHLPALMVAGRGFLADGNDRCRGKDSDDELTFAVRIECRTCGYLMLFNAMKFRTADEKIIALEGAEEEDQLGEATG